MPASSSSRAAGSGSIPLRNWNNDGGESNELHEEAEEEGLLARSAVEHEEDEELIHSLRLERDRKRRSRAYQAQSRREWLATLSNKRWFRPTRLLFFLTIGFAALTFAIFSIRSAWHTTMSHAPGSQSSSSHRPKKAHRATSLLKANELSNGTHAWRKSVLLLSLDGLKPKYLADRRLPRLLELGLGLDKAPSTSDSTYGLVAGSMKPRFPTLTFPNHWTLLTGLETESHGIIANDFRVLPPSPPPSASSGREFKYTDPLKSHDGAWWGGVPLWAVAERAGVPSAVLHWPGPPRLTGGDRPSLFIEYDGKYTLKQRLDKIRSWLEMDIQKRPQVMCVYSPFVDKAAHTYGPESNEAHKAIADADEFVGQLAEMIQAGFNASMAVDFVVVSDHGMAQTSNEKLVYLDEELGPALWSQLEAYDGWPSFGLHFKGKTIEEQMGWVAKAEEKLKTSPGLGKSPEIYRKEDVPKKWHWAGNERLAPLWVIPKFSWSITTRAEMDSFNGVYEPAG